ncbi:hypothetical protein VCHA53O466_40387 [Vibrio chagasii]|nr:hypothetical protein VCHA53O466_40387 [Vibrio chagasii]
MNNSIIKWIQGDTLVAGVNVERVLSEACVLSILNNSVLSGCDVASVDMHGGTAFIKIMKNGVLVGDAISAKVSFSNLDFLGGLTDVNGDYRSVSIGNIFCFARKKILSDIESTLSSDEEVIRMLKNSSGVIFLTARDDICLTLMMNSIGKVCGDFNYDAHISRGLDGWIVRTMQGITPLPDIISVQQHLRNVGARQVSLVDVASFELLEVVECLSSGGLLVVLGTVGQSNVHTLASILRIVTPSRFSSFYVGGISGVFVPTFSDSGGKNVLFSETYCFEYFNKIDTSPMPTDVITETMPSQAPSSSQFISDSIVKPHDPVSLMKNDLTVLDLYALLRMSKWESSLDKSMPLVKSLKTGINIIDGYVGKF